MPVPWIKLILYTPQLIELSRELLQRARGKPAGTQLVPADTPSDLPLRLAALEENEMRQAELVERMAVQLSQLSDAVVTLHKLQRWLIAAIVVLGLVLAWKIFFG
jgi:hypothetical protein